MSNSILKKVKVIKMRPSHLPVLMAVCRYFGPGSVIECGTGNMSTPYWMSQGMEYTGIEHDPAWAKVTKKIIGGHGKLFVHPVKGVIFSTLFRMLTKKQKKSFADYYNGLARNLKADVLFIDSFAAARIYAAVCLYDCADIIILHDSESRKYRYDKIGKFVRDNNKGEYLHYRYIPLGKTYSESKRPDPSTDVLIKGHHISAGFISRMFQERLAEYNGKMYPGCEFKFEMIK